MHALITRSPGSEALQAELHRDELLREAAASRLARAAAASPTPVIATAGSGVIGRIRVALGSIGRSAQPDCPECA